MIGDVVGGGRWLHNEDQSTGRERVMGSVGGGRSTFPDELGTLVTFCHT